MEELTTQQEDFVLEDYLSEKRKERYENFEEKNDFPQFMFIEKALKDSGLEMCQFCGNYVKKRYPIIDKETLQEIWICGECYNQIEVKNGI